MQYHGTTHTKSTPMDIQLKQQLSKTASTQIHHWNLKGGRMYRSAADLAHINSIQFYL